MDSKTAIKMIEEDGWYLDRVKGSHHQYKHSTKKGTVTIPHPRKDLGHLEKSIKKTSGAVKPPYKNRRKNVIPNLYRKSK